MWADEKEWVNLALKTFYISCWCSQSDLQAKPAWTAIQVYDVRTVRLSQENYFRGNWKYLMWRWCCQRVAILKAVKFGFDFRNAFQPGLVLRWDTVACVKYNFQWRPEPFWKLPQRPFVHAKQKELWKSATCKHSDQGVRAWGILVVPSFVFWNWKYCWKSGNFWQQERVNSRTHASRQYLSK